MALVQSNPKPPYQPQRDRDVQSSEADVLIGGRGLAGISTSLGLASEFATLDPSPSAKRPRQAKEDFGRVKRSRPVVGGSPGYTCTGHDPSGRDQDGETWSFITKPVPHPPAQGEGLAVAPQLSGTLDTQVRPAQPWGAETKT